MAWERHEQINTHAYITEEFGDGDQDQEPWSRLFQISEKKDYKLVSNRFERASVIISLKSRT